jgi:hypothetical protein
MHQQQDANRQSQEQFASVIKTVHMRPFIKVRAVNTKLEARAALYIKLVTFNPQILF